MNTIIDKYYTRNATGISAVEFFWGLGFPVVMESTFLQLFLKQLGASDFLIGMVPAILFLSISAFPLVSGYYSRNMVCQRNLVMNLHLVSSLAVLGFGLLLFFMENTGLILLTFFISYAVFSACVGLTLPVWLNYLVRIFSPGKSVKGLAVMYTAQNTAKVIAGLFIVKMVDTFSLSIQTAGWIFLGAGFAFLAGSFFFLMTREFPETTGEATDARGMVAHTRDKAKEILGNRNLVCFIAGDLDTYIVATAMSFYANYAVRYFGISTATAAGLFVGVIYSGSILASLALGTFDMLNLRAKFLSTKVLTMALLLVLILFPGFWGFMIASLMMGFCRGARGILYSPLLKKLGRQTDATAYFAVVPLLTLLFSSGWPLLFGRGLDWMAPMGAAGYQVMFGLSFLLAGITLVFGWMTDFTDPAPGMRMAPVPPKTRP